MVVISTNLTTVGEQCTILHTTNHSMFIALTTNLSLEGRLFCARS